MEKEQHIRQPTKSTDGKKTQYRKYMEEIVHIKHKLKQNRMLLMILKYQTAAQATTTTTNTTPSHDNRNEAKRNEKTK